MTRISVALCTYNGERFLDAQLASIEAQTRLPDEVVACDDRSNDNTVAVLRAFQDRAPFPVRVVSNDTRLGATGNFEKAIKLCTGDLIALADQDDVWLPEKVARSETALAAQPGVGPVFSNAKVVDETLRPLGYNLWEAIGFSAGQQDLVRGGRALPVLLYHQVVTGATMTFRADLRPFVLPIPRDWVHDGWIAFLVAATGQLALVQESLILYRQHRGNQIGGRRRGFFELLRRARRPHGGRGFVRDLARFRVARAKLSAPGVRLRDPATLVAIDDLVAHLMIRTSLGRSRLGRLGPVLREARTGRYGRYSLGIVSVAQDLLL